MWAQKAENVFSFYAFASEGLRRLTYTSNAVESINKQLKRMLKKHVQFMGEDSLARKAVAMFVRYNQDPSKRRVRAWKDVVEEMEK